MNEAGDVAIARGGKRYEVHRQRALALSEDAIGDQGMEMEVDPRSVREALDPHHRARMCTGG